jgi:hypothetical protein
MAASRAGLNFLGALTLIVLASLAIIVAYDQLTDDQDPLRPRVLFPAAELAPGEVRSFAFTTRDTRELGTRSFEGASLVVHVARLDDGELRAFDAASTSPVRPCITYWREVSVAVHGRGFYFNDPCLGATFTIEGAAVFGPVPRGLDRVHLEVRDGLVVVDPSRITPGEPWTQSLNGTPAGTTNPGEPVEEPSAGY